MLPHYTKLIRPANLATCIFLYLRMVF